MSESIKIEKAINVVVVGSASARSVFQLLLAVLERESKENECTLCRGDHRLVATAGNKLVALVVDTGLVESGVANGKLQATTPHAITDMLLVFARRAEEVAKEDGNLQDAILDLLLALDVPSGQDAATKAIEGLAKVHWKTGVECPVCHTKGAVAVSQKQFGTRIIQQYVCNECTATIQEVYKLVRTATGEQVLVKADGTRAEVRGWVV